LTGTVSEALADGTKDGISAESVQVSVDNGQTWHDATVSGTSWSYNLTSPPSSSGFTVQARVADLAGNAGTAATQQITSVDGGNSGNGGDGGNNGIPNGGGNSGNGGNSNGGGGTQAITIDAVDPNTGPNTGVSSSEFITNPTLTPELAAKPFFIISGGLNGPLPAGSSVEFKITDAGSQVITDISSEKDASSFVFMGQNFTVKLPPTTLQDGTYGLTAVVYDASGAPQGSPANATLVIDKTAPTSTAALTAISSDVGTSTSDFITNDPHQTFSGTLSAALADGSQSGVSQETVMIDLINQSSGQSILNGPVAAEIKGQTWSFTPDFPLYGGTYTVQLQVKDAAGNAGPPVTDTQEVVIDTLAPSVQFSAVDGGNRFTIKASDPGAIVDGLSTSGTHLTLSGGYSGDLANGKESGISAERIEVDVGDGTGWHEATVDTAAKTWTLDYTSVTLTSGAHEVQVRAADAAGNAGSPVSNTITIDPTMTPVASPDPKAGSNDTLNLSLHDVLSDAGTLTGAGSSAARQVTINSGGAVSTVHLVEGVGAGANQWQGAGTTTVNGVLYDLYHNTAQGTSTAADLLLQHGITVI
jgi:hypothetical protein